MTRETMDRRLLHSIDIQPTEDGQPACGCVFHDNGRIYLCQYHQGFDDGLEAADRAS